MTDVFISHSTDDDAVVRELQTALADLGVQVWIDSRQLRGGDRLWPEVQRAIEASSAFVVLVSPAALQSRWVGKELKLALHLQAERGADAFPVIPLSLDGTKLGVLEALFEDEPAYIPVRSAAGGVMAALDGLLVALGRRLPADQGAEPQPPAEPVEELVLELNDLNIRERDGVRRATARARLHYQPANPGLREVASARWRLVAPLGPIEADDLRWYLERYAIWPSPLFAQRARQVEANLQHWGRLLHQAALPPEATANVLQAWARLDGNASRRFSVLVDPSLDPDDLEAGGDGDATPARAKATANANANANANAKSDTTREAATTLLALPWELLHDGDSFLFQGARPTRVRRRLTNTKVFDVPVVATPIRVLLITARPVDDACGFLDHRSSALPLVDAAEALAGLLRLQLLNPPTLPALDEELQRASRAGEPYHVVHFDGHGVYDRRVGLGGLCFEDPADVSKLEGRRHQTVLSNKLAPLLMHHRIPLVFLEACQTAQAEDSSESIASELLQQGVASVVAMSHSVLVETARRFVDAFYRALAQGERVGGAMLAGQRALHNDTFRGQVFGAGELRLADWFVPVLYQEKDDPQLFRSAPAPQTVADWRAALQARLGELPPPPPTGFVGRSHDLLALERLLRQERWAVLRGQGGEGKTTLAVEVARWLVRSQQLERCAFVSVESHGHQSALLDALGRQLVGASYSAATFSSLEEALLPIERALRERPALLVIDNMESVLLPPYLDTPDLLSEEAARELEAILALAHRLLQAGQTRLLFTSREPLPAPFNAPGQLRELRRLERDDAVKLVERALNAVGATGDGAQAQRESIEALVDAVQGHARTLALLAPELRRRGVDATRAELVALMTEMERQFPGSREHSLFASVELSLRRLSPENRERARVLGVFQGGVALGVLGTMTAWEAADVVALAEELIATGLATPNPYNHLSLNPALCPYLHSQLEPTEREALTARWGATMAAYVNFLYQQQSQNTALAATLTLLELPNLFALLDRLKGAGDGEATIGLANSLYGLLQTLGKPRLLERVGQARDAAAALGDAWSHAHFEASLTRLEQQLAGGQLAEALEAAEQLLHRAQSAGEQAYPEADYDLAMAYNLFGDVLRAAGRAEQALWSVQESRQRFLAIAMERSHTAAEKMASICLSLQGNCFLGLGRYDEAAAAYEEAIRLDKKLEAPRHVAVCKAQLGTVRLEQRRYPEAQAAYEEAKDTFSQLNEPGSVATTWHQIGRLHQEAAQGDLAEEAYRQSLALNVRLGNVAGQARTLAALGNVYDNLLNRSEEAVTFHQQAATQYLSLGDLAGEGLARSNLAFTLRKLHRLDEARLAIDRAIACEASFGHAAEPWKTQAILADIETDAGNITAATEARRQATALYLAYRQDGGENHFPDGRIALAVSQALLAGEPTAATSLLEQLAAAPEAAGLLPFLRALQAIVAGSRDRSLAEDTDLNHTMAAELLLLIDTLEHPQ
jgi:tetratricopeptide (TPR) repeat protein